MSWFWRALAAALLLVGTTLWLPVAATDAATSFGSAGISVRGPVADDNDNDGNDEDDNDNEDEDDNDNADNDNDVDVSTSSDVPTDPSRAGASVSNADVTIDLWRSNERPVVNTPFQIGITGSGAPIERIWWWAEGAGGAGPSGDDFAHLGVQTHDCGGTQPCVQGWTLVARNVGWYNLHARVRDTSGREVQTDWNFLVSENPRSG